MTRAEELALVQRRSYAGARSPIRSSWPEGRALSAAELAALVERRRYAVLATASPDARAHATPVAYSYGRGAFWVASVEGLRLRNLRTSPWASLVVLEGEGESHTALTAEGPVVLHEGSDLASAIARLEPGWSRRHGGEPTWAAALVELRPERVFSYASRAGG